MGKAETPHSRVHRKLERRYNANGNETGNSFDRFAVIVPKEKKNETGVNEEEDDGALGEEHSKEVFSFSIAAAWANY